MFLLPAVFSIQQLTAQEKTKTELEKEKAFLQAIDEQKKAMADQKKAQQELEIQWKEQGAKLEEIMKDFRVREESSGPGRGGEEVRIYTPRGSRSFSFNDPMVFTPGTESLYLHSIGESEGTTWDFSRSVKENSFSKEYTFDVDKTAKSVVMSVRGDCKAGDIRINIILPNGKSYSDIVIDEFGNLNWRKSFTISETENQDKTGDWKFKIESNKATGYFRISLQTY